MLLGAANYLAWLVDFEQILKVILLLVSIGYAVQRWWHFNQTKKGEG